MNNAVSNTSPSYRHLPATSGANRRSKFVARSHALTHAAKATRVYTTACAHTDAARPDKPLQSLQATKHANRTKHVKQLFYPSNQPVVQVFTAQTAIKFIVINTETQTSSNRNSGSSVGLSYGTSGLTVNASANKSKGQGNGDDVTYTNTRIEGSAVKLKSAGDTTLQGAVIAAGSVKADIGGNLRIESLQDKSTYQETQKSSGFSVSADAGIPSGSISGGKTNINSNFQSVGEQSGIKAGDGGFNVNVKGQTSLVGGVITSSDKAQADKKNSFNGNTPEGLARLSTTDIQNTAAYNASANSITLGVGTDLNKSGAGLGKATGSAASTTQSGITGVAGKKDAKTGDKEVGIQPIFDKDKVKADVNAQVQITKQFGQNASKAVGDYAGEKLKAAQASGNQAEIDQWKEGGAARVALHTLVGALGGGVAGAAGAASSQTLVPVLGEQIAKLDIPVELKQVLVQVASAAVGAVAGGTAGVASAVNATSQNYLNHTELKTRAEQQKACAAGAAKACQVVRDMDQKSAERNTTIRNGTLVVSPEQASQILKDMQTTMVGLAGYKTELQTQLDKTSDPQQRAELQGQINQTDLNLKQAANLGKDYQYALYQQTGDPKHLQAYVQLNTVTNGNDLADALMAGGVAIGSGSKPPKATGSRTPGVEVETVAKAPAAATAPTASNQTAGVNGGVTAPATPGKLTGSTETLTPAEKSFIGEMVAGGKTVEVIPATNTGRSADFFVNGVKYELKTMTNVTNTTPDGLSSAVSSTAMNARGQSGNIIIDARGQTGMTPEIAERGIIRALSRDTETGSKIQGITVITPQGTVYIPRKPS